MKRENFETKRTQIIDRIVSAVDDAKKEGLSQVEIYAGYGNGTSVSLEKNDIQTYETYEETVYGIRVIENFSEGFVTTNDSRSLLESIRQAASLARSQNTPDPCVELPPPPEFVTSSMDHLDESLFGYDPNSVLELAKNILEIREKDYPKVSLDSAEVSLSYSLKAIASSKGILRSEAASSLSSSFMGMAIDGDDIGSFDSESAFGRSPREYEEDFRTNYWKFLNSCMGGLGAKTIPSFKGYVYLPPESIFSFLIGGLLGSLSAYSIRMKRSKLEGKIGEQVVSPMLSLYSDPTNPELAGCTAFDREGQNTRKMEIITAGVLKNYFFNHYEAKKAGLPASNGFATGGSGGLPGCGAKALQVSAGSTPVAQMLSADRKILWVNRFSGSSNGSSGDFSGVIKGGFLWEANEKIPVKEVQIAGNLYTILKEQLTAVSRERELIGKSTWAPSFLLEGMSVTGTKGNSPQG